uniref:uncharacterized protein n=1 Tax=Semicossyphus pulcher TaxID=241346 RepID=UPI0037E7455B
MRTQWIVSIATTLLCMGILVVVMGQYKVLILMDKGEEKLKRDVKRLDNQYVNEDLVKTTMEKMLVQAQKAAENLQAEVNKLSPEMQKKKAESYVCQEGKKTTGDELAGTEKERTETEASLKVESDAWNQEMNVLKEQLTGYRQICDHVKQVPLALKLCGPKPS